MVVIQLVSISGSATKIPLAQGLSVEAVEKSPESRMEPVPFVNLVAAKRGKRQSSVPFSLMLQRFFLAMPHCG